MGLIYNNESGFTGTLEDPNDIGLFDNNYGCDASFQGYICTQLPHPKNTLHVAGAGFTVAAVWWDHESLKLFDHCPVDSRAAVM